MTGATVTSTSVEDVVVVRVDGEIDFSNAGDVGDQIEQAVSNDALGLVIDASGLRYVDSAGVRMLFRVTRELDACRQGTRIVIGDGSPIMRLVTVTNLDAAAPLATSIDDALNGIRSSAEDRL